MTDHRPPQMPSDADVAIVLELLSREVPEEHKDSIRRRLDEDPAFRERAIPIIAAFTLPVGEPAPAISHEDLAREWDRFTRKANFVHQQRRKRRLFFIIGGIIMLLIAIPLALGLWSTHVATDALRLYYANGHSRIADSTRVMTIAPGVTVTLEQGATLAQPPLAMPMPIRMVTLTGTATFTVERDPSIAGPIGIMPIGIRTAGGLVSVPMPARVKVIAHGDTTEVIDLEPPVVHRAASDPSIAPGDTNGFAASGMVAIMPTGATDPKDGVVLRPHDRARVVAGGKVVLTTAVADSGSHR